MTGSVVQRLVAGLGTRPLLVSAIVVPAAVFAAAAAVDYQAERREVRKQVHATSSALSEHAQTVVETTDLVLARVLDRVSGMDWPAIGQSTELHAFLLDLREGLPQIESIFLVQPDGGNVATTRRFPIGDVPNVADRDYFQAATRGEPGTFISAPFASRLDGGFAFAATRARVRGGVFDGLAGVTISPDYFADFYTQAVDYPGESVTNLIRADGTIMFRFPAAGGAPRKLPPDSAFMRVAAAHESAGEFDGRSPVDGRQRIGTYHRLRNAPFFVSYSVNASAYLRPWRRNLLFIGGFSAMLASALLLTQRLQLRQVAAERRAADALVQEVERRRRAELAMEQMQKMEALGRLSGGVAHDFNNLLTAILAPLELASKRVTDPRLLRLLSGAMQAAQRGAKLTAQMLAVARNREAVAVTLNPNATIRELGEMIGRTIGPMVELSYELDLAATPISVDAIQLEMTLLNLCVNARDAMPGGGKLLLRTRLATRPAPPPGVPGLPPGDYVEVSAPIPARACMKTSGRGLSSRSSPPSNRGRAPASASPPPTASRSRPAVRWPSTARRVAAPP